MVKNLIDRANPVNGPFQGRGRNSGVREFHAARRWAARAAGETVLKTSQGVLKACLSRMSTRLNTLKHAQTRLALFRKSRRTGQRMKAQIRLEY
jgi:hypothetical protein